MKLLQRSDSGHLASQTLAGHLLRGGMAAGLLALAWQQQHTHPVVAAAAALAALVAMRGCPVCWSIGLVETVAQRLRRPGP